MKQININSLLTACKNTARNGGGVVKISDHVKKEYKKELKK